MKLLLASFIILLAQSVVAQTARYSVHDVLSKAAYLEDFNQLVDSITTNHPQPYEFGSEEVFDRYVNLNKHAISDSTTIGEFSWICNAVASKIGCSHTYTSAASIMNLPHELFFPVSAQYIGSKLFVVDKYNPNSELTPGIEILKINGVNVADLKRNIAEHISSDGHNHKFAYARINRSFGYFCAYQLNFPKVYKVVILDKGIKKEIMLNEELTDTLNKTSTPTENLTFSIDASEKMAIMTIKNFIYYNDQFPVFRSFVDSCFDQIMLHGIENLVIDLRGNGGGDPYCAVHLLQYVSDSPFRYYKKGMTTYYKDLEEKISPFENNFSGNLYILINSLCSSTTGHLCSILKHNNLGTLIGRETGATFSCNAKTIQFELQNTGIYASVATKTYQTDVTGFVKNRGVIPHYEMNRNLDDIISKKDIDIEKAMELIGND